MRALFALALLALAQPALAQGQRDLLQQAAQPPGEADPFVLAEQLNSRLLAAQQRIAELEQQLSDAQGANTQSTAQAADLRAKNERLVEIGQALIASYQQRYDRSNFGPFQFGRVRFERELQDMGDQLHANRADALPARPASAEDQQTQDN